MLEKLISASKQGNLNSLTDLLSQKTLDVNHIGHDGKSALYHAISQQHIPAIKALLQHGVDVQQTSFATYHRDHTGVHLISCDEPPLVTAARVDNTEIVQILLGNGAYCDAQAVCHTHLSGVSINDRTPLHFACLNINVEMVQCLMNYNAEVNIRDKQGEYPIHAAVRCRQCIPQIKIVQLLCTHGADVNGLNKFDCTPLYLASFYGCTSKAEMLILHGADVNKLCERESSYGTALHIAAMKNRLALTEKLVTHGAKLSFRNALHYTPLHLNINSHSESSIAPLLIYHGANTEGFDKFNYTIMASVIRNMRFDCELLAKLLVYTGYDLEQDSWLSPKGYGDSTSRKRQDSESSDTGSIPEIPIPAGRVSNLCEWLNERKSNPLLLAELCRIMIRQSVSKAVDGSSIVPCLNSLPLPTSLKAYVKLDNLVDMENFILL